MILAIDQGTTGTTCLVVDRDGRVRGRAASRSRRSFPAPGLVVHDPRRSSVTVRVGRRRRHRQAGAAPVGRGDHNQREDHRDLERDGAGRCIRRSLAGPPHGRPVCRAPPEADRIGRRTGLVVDPY
jgi:glycerol kinase